MANTSDSSPTNSHSPGGSNLSTGDSGRVMNSPTKLRLGNLPSPWSQVVGGGGGTVGGSSVASEAIAAVNSIVPGHVSPNDTHLPRPRPSLPSAASLEDVSVIENYEKGGDNNVGTGGKKPAWNKRANGCGDATTNPVIGGTSSWPALSESTRLSLKFSDESSKSATDGSTSVSMSKGPVTSDSHPKQGTHVNPNSTASNTVTVRQRSMKRGGGGNRQVAFAHAPAHTHPGPAFPVTEIPLNSFGNMVPIISDPFSREIRPIGGLASPSHPANNHFVQRGSPRRGHLGQNARGDGSHSNTYEARRDQERGHYDWTSNTSLNGRDFHAHPWRANSRGYRRPPAQGIAPDLASQPVRPHGNPMIYHDISSPLVCYLPMLPEPFRGVIFPAPPPAPLYMPYMEPDFNLPFLIVKQIDYYFSDANLVRDDFLRSNMDDEGWVPIKLIANFPRVQHLIKDNIPFMLESLRGSNIVEVQGEKIRRRDGWKKWILQNRLSTNLGAQSTDQSRNDGLTTSIKEMSLHDIIINQDTKKMDEP
ncbi:hypothetical protein Ancab_006979 [Ancistrocladus abbreviatus]